MKRITADMLEGACKEQRELFKATFPEGAPVTMASLEKAEKAGLDIWWVERLAGPAYSAQRKPLYDAYSAQRKTLCDAYWEQRKPLEGAYSAQRKLLDDAYEAQCKLLLIKCLREVER